MPLTSVQRDEPDLMDRVVSKSLVPSNYIVSVQLLISSGVILPVHAITIRLWGQGKPTLAAVGEPPKRTIRIAAIAQFSLRSSLKP